jgi:hypothetical protein
MNFNNQTLTVQSANSDHTGIIQFGNVTGTQWLLQSPIIVDSAYSGTAGGTTNPTATPTRKRIGPRLYFNYVKSKLRKTEVKKLKARLKKLQQLVKNAEEVGQKALYEEFSKMLIIAVRESEAAACGYNVIVNKEDVEKFRILVSESDATYGSPVFFKTLEEFPRPIPAKVQKIIKSVQAKAIFDKLHVLYLDYTKEPVKSNKEKIREKDPVLFGSFNYDEKRLYYITDWVDEHCDLTLNGFVEALKQNNEEYQTSTIEDITPEYLERIKKEIQDREDRLKDTNSGNFRNNMANEDEIARLRTENAKLREDERHRAEDKEIAIERALADRAKWREEASKEGVQENVVDPVPTPEKKSFFKKLFGF